ncbi:hypothetical protein PGB90_002579 [Kerria lacca]
MSDCAGDTYKMDSNRSSTTSPIYFNSKSESSSGYVSSSSPTPSSPQSVSPPHTLKRSRTSSFRLINRRISTISNCSQISVPQEPADKLTALIGWYPAFLIRIYLELIGMFVFVVLKHLPFIIPTLWFSVVCWVLSKMMMIPISIMKGILIFIFMPASKRRQRKQTVLISGGSSVQAVYLARHFYSAGARIIICEIEGNFQLARFSTAVQQYYTVPQPNDEHFHEYVNAIKSIVLKEKVTCFIPVSEKNTAYYDSLIKPYIEELGCECICPDVPDVLLLDDMLALMRQIEKEGMLAPPHYLVHSNSDLNRLYDLGTVKHEPHVMVKVGISGCKNHLKINLPPTRRRLKLTHQINDANPWLVVQNYDGDKYITCTTIRDTEIICNVTCKIDSLGGLVPVYKLEIENWLSQFFSNLKASDRNIIGHMSFYFTTTRKNDKIFFTGCEVGVRKPYICYTSVQSRIVWKSCQHFNRYTSGPVVDNSGIYWLHKIVLKILEFPNLQSISNVINIVRGRQDALFVLWDPLPYCAFYYLQVPLNSVSVAIKKCKIM